MTSISFSLICRKNPSITDADDIDIISRLDLDNSNIHEIDNLELFSHIRELNLQRNKIKTFSNLKLLSELQLLDVSFNEITSETLLSSMKFLPKGLATIVLTGNPCASDEEALGKLQDCFPELGIAIEEVSSAEEDVSEAVEKESADDDDNDAETHTEDEEVVAPKGPVNADEVLKYIVDRKCKLQSIQNFNIDSVVKVRSRDRGDCLFAYWLIRISSIAQELNEEANFAMENTKRKRLQSKKDHFETTPDSIGTLEERYKRGIEDLRRKNDTEKSSFEDVMQRLKGSAKQHLDQISSRRNAQPS